MAFRTNALHPPWLHLNKSRRFCCAATTEKTQKNLKTVFLPQSNFVNHVKSTERSSSDQKAAILGGLDDLYEWQLGQNDRPCFELLDGPPYANGEAHTGHAINKVLKDFIVKSRIGLGYKVLFRPGWDCHGLPIELKISKSTKNTLKTPLEIREAARTVADEAIGKQMNAFRRWGVTADWKNPYITKSREYVTRQLQIFGDLVEKQYVYRAFKPVYWSPSSNTALAESELEYNDNHRSTSVYFRFKIINVELDSMLSLKKPSQFFALVWTTTPWTLPLNNAICVSKNLEYTIFQFDDEVNNPTHNFYLIASRLLEKFEKEVERKCEVVGKISGESLIGKKYVSCWHKELALPIYDGDHVTETVGTGLVHTSFAHGFQDYDIAISNSEKVDSFVDSKGCYTRHMGHELSGKFVLEEGQKTAIRALNNDIVHSSKYVHSYPYDWRTKKPVIIRSSEQWFINVGDVGLDAAEMINKIEVSAGTSDLRGALKQLVVNRKLWCISRQRCWGTPIPALIDKESKSYTSKRLISFVAEKIIETGDIDYWWKCSVEDLLASKDVKTSLNLKSNVELTKNQDIMDVWLDSGLAWYAARNDCDEPADLVLEGVDQFRGWFQSLLLTSVATRNTLPYKKIIVHGFCIDENNNKMSKSIGNVIDPAILTDGSLKQKAIGADGLRLWVGLSAAENAGESKISQKIVEDIDKKMTGLRNGFRFMIGGCFGYDGIKIPRTELRLLDQDVLWNCDEFVKRCIRNYDDLKFRTVANDLIQFMQRDFSANYVKYVRDRLYCDKINSNEHLSAQFTLHRLAFTISHVISPILPHLSAEVLSHLPGNGNRKILRSKFVELLEPKFSYNPKLLDYISDVNKLRKILERKAGPKVDTSKKAITLDLDNALMKELFDSGEICEMFNVSEVRHANEMEIVEASKEFCSRCRTYRREKEEKLCKRCSHAILY